MSFLAPLWLLGLLGLPLLWWLHRNSSRGTSILVSSLRLWPDPMPQEPAAAASERRPVDLVWLRRAFIVAMLAIALADPALIVPHRTVAVWFDDSLSMSAREATGTRLELAVAGIDEALGGRDDGAVVIHPLSNPSRAWQRAELRAQLAAAGADPPGAPVLPAPASLRADSEHWLVTDGADPRVDEWMRSAPISRVIQVGSAAENVALVGLSLRAALAGRERQAAQALVLNTGPRRVQRRIELADGGRLLWAVEADLEPGRIQRFEMEVDGAPSRLTAGLAPHDALEQDDSIELSGTVSKPLLVALDPRCPRALQAAVRAHPATRIVPGTGAAEIDVDCSGRQPAAGTAQLRVWPVLGGRPVVRIPSWNPVSDAAGRRAPDAGNLLTLATPLRIDPGDTVLLGSPAEPLVLRRATKPAQVEVALDLGHDGFSAEAEYPLFVSLLLELTSGRPLLDGLATATRSAEEAAIAPRARLVAAGPSITAPGAERNLSGWFLWPALLAMAWELAAATRSLRVTRHYYRGDEP